MAADTFQKNRSESAVRNGRGETAADALREEQNRCRSIIESIEDGYYELDLDGTFTFFNDNMVLLSGYSKSELSAMSYWDIMDPYSARHMTSVLSRVRLLGIGARAVHCELLRKDGRRRSIEISAALKCSALDKPIGFMGIARDTTQHKQIMSVLKESEERFRAIIAGIEDGYYEVDLKGNMQFFNRSMARMLGYPPGELVGMNNRVFMDRANAKKVFRVFNRVYRTGVAAKALDWELIRKDEGRCTIEASISLMKDSDGRPTGFMGIARDITDRKAQEGERVAREQALEAMNTALKIFIKSRQAEQAELDRSIRQQIDNALRPCTEALCSRTKGTGLAHLALKLRGHLDALSRPFSTGFNRLIGLLSATEIEVARLVKEGFSSKEIADLLNVSIKTVEAHRTSIRKKLGLTDRKTNLKAFLVSSPDPKRTL
jgi:PAS domain S-box-containing protein